MPATILRAYLVILVGVLLGLSLLVDALRQWASRASATSRRSLHPLEVLARLLLDASLLLLALVLLAGRTLWTDTRDAPTWATPTGVASSSCCSPPRWWPAPSPSCATLTSAARTRVSSAVPDPLIRTQRDRDWLDR